MTQARAWHPRAWHEGDLPWQDCQADGTRYALLEGIHDQPGVAFSDAFFIPA